jgi:rRNA maturation endonuclease Nob1
MEGFDLRKYQEEGPEKDKIKSIMGKVLSGREGYEPIVETKKIEKKCHNCNWHLEGGEKFCPECGGKV